MCAVAILALREGLRSIHKNMLLKTVALGWLLAVAAIGGCADTENLCDPGQTYSNGICFAPDAPAPTADADARFAHFGDVCTANPECALPTAFCVILPGATSGYCTAVGCLADPGVCPATWGCVDLSVYGEGLPSICSAP
jgi:hypothetical protein